MPNGDKKPPNGNPKPPNIVDDSDLATKIEISVAGGGGSGDVQPRREGPIFDKRFRADDYLRTMALASKEGAAPLQVINYTIVPIRRETGVGDPGDDTQGIVYQVQALSPTQVKQRAIQNAERLETRTIGVQGGVEIAGVFAIGKGYEDGFMVEQMEVPVGVTADSLQVESTPIPGTNRRNVTVLSNGRAIQNYSVETDGTIDLQETYSEALAAGAGIPPNRLEVGTTVVDGKQYFYPTIGEERFDAQIIQSGGRDFLQDRQGNLRELQKTYEPGTFYDAQTDRHYVQQPNGTLQALPRDYVPGVVEEADREFLVQPTGERRELARQFEPGFITDPDTGERLIQQPTGAVSQPRPVNMDEIITQALIDGDYDKAMAFDDFKNRPSAMEAFQAALNFARSPADQQLISSIARGEVTVEPPDPGLIRRVGPQPDFLVEEYNTFQQRLRAGRQPSQSEQAQYLQRHQEGRSPYSDQVDEANANLTSQLEDARSLARTQKEDFNRELGKFRDELVRLQSEPVGGNGGDAGGSGGAGDTRGQKGGDFNISGLAGSGAQIFGSNVDSSAGIRNIRQLAAQLGADANGNMPRIGLEFPHHPEAGEQPGHRQTGINSAKFSDFKKWVIAAKQPGATVVINGQAVPVTDANIGTYLGQRLEEFEFDTLNSDETYNILVKMGENNLDQATITNSFSQNMAAGAPAASAGDVDVEAGADGTVGAETVIDPYEQLAYRGMVGVGEEAFTLDDLYSQLGEARRVRDERREEQRREAERARRERQAAAAADVYVEDDPFVSGPIVTPARDRDRDPVQIPSAFEGMGSGDDDPLDFSTDPVESRYTPSRRRQISLASRPEPRGIQFVDEYAGGGMTRGDNLELVGEEGPELVDLPPGTHVIPFQQLNRRQLRQLQRDGVPGYAGGGIVFGSETLPLGLRQLQAGRQITPSRGYLSQQAGLTIPSVQAFQNLTPESRDIFRDTAMQAGIPARAFEQELALARPGGARLPLARFQPTTRRGIR